MPSPPGLTKAERSTVRLIAAIQFINILDFMMVMPLGGDFAKGLGISTQMIGLIGGSYTFAAFFAGLAGALFLDRLDRRKALAIAMTGLVISTGLGGLALGLKTLMAARLMAGLFGGPATSLSIAIIADQVAVERRGRAMGTVGSAFSVAAVLGVPIGLKLAEMGSWRMPFFAVAGLGLVTVFGVVRVMPAMRGHLAGLPPFNLHERIKFLGSLLRRKTTLIAYSATSLMLMGSFLLVPNVSAYVQFNLGYPRDQLAWLYALGGGCAFFSQRLVGKLVDRVGSARVGFGLAIILCAIDFALYVDYNPVLPVLILFAAYITVNSARYVATSAAISKVPGPDERAGFMSMNAAVQNFGSSTAAYISSLILVARPDGSLLHMPRVGILAMIVIMIVPFLLYALERRIGGKPINRMVENAAEVGLLE
jgi:predicted MFS family arabinose efflux permease